MISRHTLSLTFIACTLLVLALPLLSLPPVFSPPDWGKTLVFRIILSVQILIFAVISFFYPNSFRTIRWKQKEGIGFLILFGILGLSLLATIFSFDQSFSVWGSPFRSGGVINSASYIIFATLAFLILKPKDWNIAWNVSICIATLVSIMALIQWQGLFSDIFVKTGARPTSSLGNPILLAMYLLFFVFPVISFGLKHAIPLKKIAYLLLAFLFVSVIIITQSRSSYLGLAVAFSFFAFLYPFKSVFRARVVKGLFLCVAAASILLIYLINTTGLEDFPKFVQENHSLFGIVKRMDIDLFLKDPRFSTWQVAMNAIKERPLLGYGPENFEVAFDRNYDPRLPGIQFIQDTPNSWWDRAHNFLLENAAQTGVPAAIFTIALFLFLLCQLQKIKTGKQEQMLFIHGIQASFIGYFVANFFSFDTFSTFIIFFFLVSYSLFLIHSSYGETHGAKEISSASAPPTTQKKAMLFVLAIFLVWFNWQYAVRPLQINGGLNMGAILSKAGRCEEGLKLLDNALLESKETFLNPYTRLKYFDTLKICNDTQAISNEETAQKGYQALEEASNTWPTHTRTWIFLGQLANIIAEQQGKTGTLTPEQHADLVTLAHGYFGQARTLSPGHLEVYIDWVKTFLIAQDYEGALAKAQECIDQNPETGECWFLKGIVEQFRGEPKKRAEYMEIAKAKKFFPERNMASLTLLAQAYLTSQDIGNLATTYEIMVSLQPANYQLRASLAFTYYQLLQFDKAKEQALKVLEYNPQAKAEVEEFLKLLK